MLPEASGTITSNVCWPVLPYPNAISAVTGKEVLPTHSSSICSGPETSKGEGLDLEGSLKGPLLRPGCAASACRPRVGLQSGHCCQCLSPWAVLPAAQAPSAVDPVAILLHKTR